MLAAKSKCLHCTVSRTFKPCQWSSLGIKLSGMNIIIKKKNKSNNNIQTLHLHLLSLIFTVLSSVLSVLLRLDKSSPQITPFSSSQLALLAHPSSAARTVSCWPRRGAARGACGRGMGLPDAGMSVKKKKKKKGSLWGRRTRWGKSNNYLRACFVLILTPDRLERGQVKSENKTKRKKMHSFSLPKGGKTTAPII